MYRDLTYLKDIHILSKVLALVFSVASICIIQPPLLLFACLLVFYLFFGNTILFVLEIFFLLLSSLFSSTILFVKILFLISVFSVFLKSIDFQGIRYFIEFLFYHKRKSKITYFCLYLCYFSKYYILYFKEFISLKKSYGKRFDFSLLKYALVQSLEKTKEQLARFMVSYRYRFYNISRKRTYVEKPQLTSSDLKYALIYVIIFFVIFVYGS